MLTLFCLLVVWFALLCTVSFCYSVLIKPVMIQRVVYRLYKFRDENRLNRIEKRISDSDFHNIEDRVNFAFKVVEIIDAGLVLAFHRKMKSIGSLSRMEEKEKFDSEYVKRMQSKLGHITLEATIYNSQLTGVVYIAIRNFGRLKAWLYQNKCIRDVVTMNQSVTNNAPMWFIDELGKKIPVPRHQHTYSGMP